MKRLRRKIWRWYYAPFFKLGFQDGRNGLPWNEARNPGGAYYRGWNLGHRTTRRIAVLQYTSTEEVPLNKKEQTDATHTSSS